MTRGRITAGAVIGALLAVLVAQLAWGQVPETPGLVPPPVDPVADLISRLLQGGGQLGLPAVIGWLGWFLAKGGITITVRLHEDDKRDLLERRRDPP